MCNFFILFVLLLFNLHISICTVTPNIITLGIINNGTNYFQCKSSDTYTLLEGEEAEVVVSHSSMINSAWCYNEADEGILFTGDFIARSKTETRLKIIKTQPGLWNCTFLTLRDVDYMEPSIVSKGVRYTQVHCTFKVRLRLFVVPTVSINYKLVNIERMPQSTSEYDYAGYYSFESGFPFDIQLFTSKEDAVPVQFSLTSLSSGRTYVNTTRENNKLTLILTEEHNNTYLDCSYTKYQNDLSLRLFMRVNHPERAVKDNPNNITLNIINHTKNEMFTCTDSPRYAILEGDDAELILNHNNMIHDARCYHKGNHNEVYTGSFTHKSRTQTRLQITKMVAENWTCIFSILHIEENNIVYNNINYDPVFCNLTIHIRSLHGPAISINKIPVETKRQDLATIDYDYLGYYYFQPGLPVYVECVRPTLLAGSIEFTLTSVSTQHVFIKTGHEYADRYANIKLTEEHNNTYLDCNYSTNQLDLLARVYLYVDKRVTTEKDSLSITINGESLQSNPILDTRNNMTVNYLFYDSSYIDDTDLMVTCERHAESQGVLRLTTDKIDKGSKGFNPTTDGHTIYTSIASNKITKDSEITCSLKRNDGAVEIYVIKFSRRWPTNDLFITGLSNRNIVLDDEKASGLVHEIIYQYKDDDVLNLKCSCGTKKCAVVWTVNDDNNQASSSNTDKFTLDYSYNNTVIKCKRNNSQAMISLTLLYQNIATNSTPMPDTIVNEDTRKDDDMNKQWFIIGGMGACLIIILLGLFIFCLRKNKTRKLQTNPQGNNYETLRSNNENSSHFEICNTYSQPLDGVNDAQYSEPYKPNLNDLYAKPVPKSKRPVQEVNEYAKVNNANKLNNDPNEITYAELSLAKPKDIYAEVIPKSRRNTRNDQPESNYAEFYAEAIPVSASHYGNTSGNQRYVNNDGRDDYAEPAYCELLVRRKMK